MEKPVAVIILNWNGEKMLAKYLPQVISATDDTIADVIVADNGSDDGSLELLERLQPGHSGHRLSLYGAAQQRCRACHGLAQSAL